MVTSNPRFRTLLAVAAGLVLVAGACSSDDTDDTTTTEAATDTTAASGGNGGTKAYNEAVQKELAEVGCYKGADDGVIGPETDAAIVAFQTAEGLSPDGEIGPETQAALTKAAKDGETVCGDTPPASTTTTSTPSDGSAPCTGAAIQAALPSGDTGTGYVCSEGYAGVSLSDGSAIVLQSVDGKWTVPGQDPCGSASAGIPPEVLEKGCAAS
ncbi:MAG: peptidoglycan-binding protein [Microthrixaceae bacterium]|nr:peptidoglycan-binding protein [Microthrixaceae bacterium]MCB1010743.1 peptidoglycan-binding protein [Microthrixaceae bacterium]MCO5320494.1 peptidoglycan-binding protein [Microthrixaceae bacterium]